MSEKPGVESAGVPLAAADWPALAGARTGYVAAQPWKHLVLDDVVPAPVVAGAAADAAGRAPGLGRSRTHRMRKSEASSGLGPRIDAALAVLESTQSRDYLRSLVGIPDLVCDPGHTLGGLHASGPGDFQSLHQDFPRHPRTRLWHRVNVLLYLSDWDAAWGGELLLHHHAGVLPDATVVPRAGRVVVFETHSQSEHAVRRMHQPAGTWRLSLASYWYSETPPPGRRVRPLLARPALGTDRALTRLAPPNEVFWGLVARVSPRQRVPGDRPGRGTTRHGA